MTASNLKPYAPWMAGLGLVGLIVAASAALIARQFNTVVQVSLVAGLLGLVLAILMNPGVVTQWAGGRQARYGTNAVIMSVAMLGIVVLVNYLVQRAPAGVRVFDWSEGSLNTLAQESIEAVNRAPQPVRAIGFYSPNILGQRENAEKLLEQFQDQAPDKFSYEFVDPTTDPVRTRLYEVSRDGTLILEMGEKRTEITFASESEITSALVGFAAPTSRTLYFLTGHGERTTESDSNQEGLSSVVGLLQKQNYEIKPLNLAATATVPSDARAIIIAGPKQPLTADEVTRLQQYLERGNASLIALLDPPAQTLGAEAPPADPLLDYLKTGWGVTARNDIVVDLSRSMPTSPLFPVAASYGTSSITDRLQGFASYFPFARSLEYTSTVAGLSQVALVEFSDQSWGETDIAALSQNDAQPGEADTFGPLTVGVSVENSATKARLIVYGDSDFASDAVANDFANANLFVNSVNWATLDETLINLTPKVPPQRSLRQVDALTGNSILFFVVIALPVLVLVAGGIVWFMRRRKA
jgi:ABC-type uncharacterized transport system involved in gliding motility auxiliary subunit